MNAAAYDALVLRVGDREAARVFFSTLDRLEAMAPDSEPPEPGGAGATGVGAPLG